MDNELSNAIHITVNLMVISVVILMIVLFTALGQGFGRDSLDKVAAVQADTYASDLIQSAAHGPMPAASVYVLLKRNEHVINSISGAAYTRNITKSDDLIPIFHKKISIKVTDTSGSYTVEIGEEWKEWGD